VLSLNPDPKPNPMCYITAVTRLAYVPWLVQALKVRLATQESRLGASCSKQS